MKKKSETWIKRFDEKYYELNSPVVIGDARWGVPMGIKSFISQLLKEKEKEVREEIIKAGFEELYRNPDWDTPQQEILIELLKSK